MERRELRAIVDTELKHIPKAPGEYQGPLRAAYNMARMHSLGRRAAKKQTAFEVLQDCIRVLKKLCPGACFCYDDGFFKGRRDESRTPWAVDG
ncbi:MAG: hypothetical protein ABFD77_08860 [Thermotogota bacterium]